MNDVNVLISELLDMVKNHDYSYQFSDDNRAWESGMRRENEITTRIYNLVTHNGVDAQTLCDQCIAERPEQYVDGLTHRVIKIWFQPHIELSK